MSTLQNQSTNAIMMVRPSKFGYNPQTAETNAFQNSVNSNKKSEISKKAIQEFDKFCLALKNIGVEVFVMHDSNDVIRPDAIFPNNWITFHENGTVITYPMQSPNRRTERREDFLDTLRLVYEIENRYSFEFYEEEEKYLEGTGSMILGRVNKVVYACLSPRTDIFLLDKFCLLMGYKLITFYATDKDGQAIYHTNVIMCIADKYAVICLECIRDEDKRREVVQSLQANDKEIIDISLDQVYQFAGNMLQVTGMDDEKFLIMSESAHHSLTPGQISALEKYNTLIPVAIPTIEKYGGGSVRCMMAEIFLPKK